MPVTMHANLSHLVVECISLQALGPELENFSGLPRFLAVYLVSGIAGSAASFASSRTMGASGTVRVQCIAPLL